MEEALVIDDFDDLDVDDADAGLQLGIARAEHARRQASAEEAELWAAIDQALTDAAEHPWVYLSAFRGTGDEGREFALRSAVADLAVRLRLAEATVRMHAHRASVLREWMPGLWRAFRDGDAAPASAACAADLVQSLPEETRAAFDDALAGAAVALSPARFRDRARRLRERLHSEPADDRQAEAATSRRVWLVEDVDGMCELTARLRAIDGRRIMARLDATAHPRATADDESRTPAQLRADVAADLLLSMSDGAPAVTTNVAVTVPVLTLLGLDEQPATLDGLVPVSPAQARELAASAPSFQRILTHPITGTVLDVDRTSYRPPADLQRWVRQEHPVCVFAGCGRRAADCDLDHVEAWEEGGVTSAANLRPLCPSHHRLKHEGGWSVRLRPDGRAVWTSPTGGISVEVPDVPDTGPPVPDTDPPPF